MDFILTYNLATTACRSDFESNIESNFPDSSKETSNQTTIVGDSNERIDKTIKKIQEIVSKINTSDNDTVTIYFPVIENGIPSFSKNEILSQKIIEGKEEQINRMKYLIDYKHFK